MASASIHTKYLHLDKFSNIEATLFQQGYT